MIFKGKQWKAIIDNRENKPPSFHKICPLKYIVKQWFIKVGQHYFYNRIHVKHQNQMKVGYYLYNFWKKMN